MTGPSRVKQIQPGSLLTPHELLCTYIDFLCEEQRPPTDIELARLLGCYPKKVNQSIRAAAEAGYITAKGGKGTRHIKIIDLRLSVAKLPEFSEMPL